MCTRLLYGRLVQLTDRIIHVRSFLTFSHTYQPTRVNTKPQGVSYYSKWFFFHDRRLSFNTYFIVPNWHQNINNFVEPQLFCSFPDLNRVNQNVNEVKWRACSKNFEFRLYSCWRSWIFTLEMSPSGTKHFPVYMNRNKGSNSKNVISVNKNGAHFRAGDASNCISAFWGSCKLV